MTQEAKLQLLQRAFRQLQRAQDRLSDEAEALMPYLPKGRNNTSTRAAARYSEIYAKLQLLQREFRKLLRAQDRLSTNLLADESSDY